MLHEQRRRRLLLVLQSVETLSLSHTSTAQMCSGASSGFIGPFNICFLALYLEQTFNSRKKFEARWPVSSNTQWRYRGQAHIFASQLWPLNISKRNTRAWTGEWRCSRRKQREPWTTADTAFPTRNNNPWRLLSVAFFNRKRYKCDSHSVGDHVFTRGEFVGRGPAAVHLFCKAAVLEPEKGTIRLKHIFWWRPNTCGVFYETLSNSVSRHRSQTGSTLSLVWLFSLGLAQQQSALPAATERQVSIHRTCLSPGTCRAAAWWRRLRPPRPAPPHCRACWGTWGGGTDSLCTRSASEETLHRHIDLLFTCWHRIWNFSRQPHGKRTRSQKITFGDQRWKHSLKGLSLIFVHLSAKVPALISLIWLWDKSRTSRLFKPCKKRTCRFRTVVHSSDVGCTKTPERKLMIVRQRFLWFVRGAQRAPETSVRPAWRASASWGRVSWGWRARRRSSCRGCWGGSAAESGWSHSPDLAAERKFTCRKSSSFIVSHDLISDHYQTPRSRILEVVSWVCWPWCPFTSQKSTETMTNVPLKGFPEMESILLLCNINSLKINELKLHNLVKRDRILGPVSPLENKKNCSTTDVNGKGNIRRVILSRFWVWMNWWPCIHQPERLEFQEIFSSELSDDIVGQI